MPEDWQNQSPDDYYRSQGLVLNSDGTEWVRPPSPWVDSTPAPYQNPDSSPADIAAYRVVKSVKRPSRLPVEQNAIPDAPTRPSYVMEPDLQEAQGGMQLPPGMMQDDSGRLFYADDPTTTIPMVKRPGLLPVANTPEGYKLVMPKLLDLAGNVMGNVGGVMGGKVAAKAGEMVLGSGMVRKAAEEFPTQAYHGTSTPGFEKFASPEAGQYMPDRALGIHVAKDPAISETFVKDKGAVYPVKIPADNKFLEVDQPLLPYIEDKATAKNPRNVHSDQNQIEKLIYKTVYKKDPEMLARYLTQARNVSEADALKLAKDMVAGKSVDLPVDGKTTFDKFIENFGGGKPYNEPDRAKAVEIFKKEMQDKGYVGIKYINTSPMETANAKDATSYIVFDPHKHIQSKYTKTLMSDTRNQVAGQVGHQVEKNGFYSALQTAVSNAKVDKADAGQWLGYLKNQPGVKSEELNYTLGKLPEGQISRSQLEDIVKQNKVALGEKVLGQPNKLKPLTEEENVKFDELNDRYRANPESLSTSEHEQLQILENRANHAGSNDPLNKEGGTKYHSYQLPGGENYKEMLLKLPEKKIDLNRIDPTWTTKKIRDGVYQAIGDYDKDKNAILAYGKTPQEALENAVKETSGDWKDTFKSSHWDEPNVLAHIRMNDRKLFDDYKIIKNGDFYNIVDQNGNKIEAGSAGGNFGSKETAENVLKSEKENLGKKVLHIEEIQSDWHQKGRKEGYKLSDSQKADLENIDNKLTSGLSEKDIGNPDMEAVLKTAVDKKVLTPEEAKNYKEYSKGENSTVPDAPFKRNWDELALKRVIRHAAENGYEGVSWTPGEAQAARYDLSKQIERIKIDPHSTSNEHHIVRLEPVSGNKMNVQIDKNGKVAASFPPSTTTQFEGKNLEDIVGKEIAEKIFDKIKNEKPYKPITKLPEEFSLIHDANGKKNGQEWGILPKGQSHAGSATGRYHKTEKEAVDEMLMQINHNEKINWEDAQRTLQNVDLKIGGEGMKSFYDKMLVDRANGLVKKYGSKVEEKELPKENRDYYVQELKLSTGRDGKVRKPTYDVRFKDVQGQERFNASYPTREEAEAKVKELNAVKGKPIHYFPITPALRDKATKEGFPLFSSGPTLIPVDHSPQFEDKKSKYKLTPVQGNPFQ